MLRRVAFPPLVVSLVACTRGGEATGPAPGAPDAPRTAWHDAGAAAVSHAIPWPDAGAYHLALGFGYVNVDFTEGGCRATHVATWHYRTTETAAYVCRVEADDTVRLACVAPCSDPSPGRFVKAPSDGGDRWAFAPTQTAFRRPIRPDASLLPLRPGHFGRP